jgi:DNA polymerase III epsilon subunit-like protein
LKQKIGATGTKESTTIKISSASSATTIPKVDRKLIVINPEEAKSAAMLKRLRDKAVALDCEMVGTGINGKYSELARCSLVNGNGDVLYDQFVQPKGFVTDFRTQWSGIRRSDINKKKAVTLEQCQQDVLNILKGKLLVGHALQNDLKVLLLSHPRLMIRDTSRYPPYMRTLPSGKRRARALKDLTKQFLHKQIQTGEHDSAEDARCTMNLYLHSQREWETYLRQKKEQKRTLPLSSKVSAVESTAASNPTGAGAKDTINVESADESKDVSDDEDGSEQSDDKSATTEEDENEEEDENNINDEEEERKISDQKKRKFKESNDDSEISLNKKRKQSQLQTTNATAKSNSSLFTIPAHDKDIPSTKPQHSSTELSRTHKPVSSNGSDNTPRRAWVTKQQRRDQRKQKRQARIN